MQLQLSSGDEGEIAGANLSLGKKTVENRNSRYCDRNKK